MAGLLLFVLHVYFFAVFYSSMRIALLQKDARLLLSMPIAFIIRNFAYGLGSLAGVIMVLGSKMGYNEKQFNVNSL
jgi:hypothetical protein